MNHFPIAILGVIGLITMAVTGKQHGGKPLHWFYRVMIVFFFLCLLLLFYLGRH